MATWAEISAEVYTRKYRRLATLQRFLPRRKGLKILSDCHSRPHLLGSGLIDIVSKVDGDAVVLFSLNVKVWNAILHNNDLLLAFDGAIRGSALSSVAGNVRAVIVKAARQRLSRYEGLRTIAVLGCDPLYNVLSTESNVVVTNWRPKGLTTHLSTNSSRDCWVVPGGLSCPVCHDTGMYFLEKKLDALISKAHYCKLAPVLLTFTVQHEAGDPLPVLFNVFKGNGKGAFERFRRSAAYKAFVTCGATFEGKPYLPYIAVTEVTLNIDYKGFNRSVGAGSLVTPDDKEAWNELCSDFLDKYGCSAYVSPHLHYHALFFIRQESLTTYKSLIPSLKAAWASAVTDATAYYLGRVPDRAAVLARGLDCGVKPCDSAEYVCKRDGKRKSEVWDGAKELTKSSAKKRHNVDPFALLDYPSPLNEAIFAEYAAACVGKQCCSHNRDNFDAFFDAAVAAETARREAAAVAEERYHEEQVALWLEQQEQQQRDLRSSANSSPKLGTPSDLRSKSSESSIFKNLVKLKIKKLLSDRAHVNGNVFAIGGEKPERVIVQALLLFHGGSLVYSRERFYRALPTGYFP